MRLPDAENSAVESALVRGLEAGSARKTILCGSSAAHRKNARRNENLTEMKYFCNIPPWMQENLRKELFK